MFRIYLHIPVLELQENLLWCETDAAHCFWKGLFHGGQLPHNPSVVIVHPGLSDQFRVHPWGVA